MDAGYLNFHKEEDFSSYFLDPFHEVSHVNNNLYTWENENEHGIASDIDLLPISSHGDIFCPLSTSPPTREDFNQIMHEWNQLVNMDMPEELVMTEAPSPEEDLLHPEGFDITKFVDQPDVQQKQEERRGGKRIDMAKRRYLIDDNGTEYIDYDAESKSDSDEEEEEVVVESQDDEDVQIDVETVAEENDHPVLQAGDLNTLLEQFEATESTNLEIHHNEMETDVFRENLNRSKIKLEYENTIVYPDIETVEITKPVLQLTKNIKSEASPLKMRKEIKTEPMDSTEIECNNPCFDNSETKISSECPIVIKQEFSEVVVKEKEAILPKLKVIKKELVVNSKKEIIPLIKKEKRETIPPKNMKIKSEPITSRQVQHRQAESAIEHIPMKLSAKDQVKSKQILDSLPPELVDRIRQTSKRKPVPVIAPLPPAKRRNVVTIKKESKTVQLDHDYCSNTPRKDSGFSSCEEDDRSILRSQPTVKNADGKLMVSLLKSNTIKKKLNLEEYKKRMQNKSQDNSGTSSPAPDENENARRLKHQEKLMQMAQEIVKQQNKPVIADIQLIKKEKMIEIKQEPPQIKQPIHQPQPIEEKPVELPPNIVMKTLVSVGTNTEESWGHLEQILQNTQVKISPNSLISSIVEHLPKVKPVIEKQVEHGEDKTIVYFDKEREKPKMCSLHVQTIHSRSSTRRRRTSSSSSSTSESSSCSSGSSRESSRSRTRSRTPSPVRKRYKEQMKEVEERRVIYVGKISDSATKDDLRRRFNRFGPITNISVHFRRRADNYGFVTFMHKEDAYEAVEKGNDNPDLPQYVLSFGGRRLFCKTSYSDLDNVSDDAGYWSPISGTMIMASQSNSFDALLKQAQAKLRKRQL